jgi:hypothetical protein
MRCFPRCWRRCSRNKMPVSGCKTRTCRRSHCTYTCRPIHPGGAL